MCAMYCFCILTSAFCNRYINEDFFPVEIKYIFINGLLIQNLTSNVDTTTEVITKGMSPTVNPSMSTSVMISRIIPTITLTKTFTTSEPTTRKPVMTVQTTMRTSTIISRIVTTLASTKIFTTSKTLTRKPVTNLDYNKPEMEVTTMTTITPETVLYAPVNITNIKDVTVDKSTKTHMSNTKSFNLTQTTTSTNLDYDKPEMEVTTMTTIAPETVLYAPVSITNIKDVTVDKSTKTQITEQLQSVTPSSIISVKDIIVKGLNNTKASSSKNTTKIINYKLPLIISLAIVLFIVVIIMLSVAFNSRRTHEPVPQEDVEMQTFRSSSSAN